MAYNYNEHTSRNKLFIESQDKIKNQVVFVMGCGLGSHIAILLARIGFCNFILADGDQYDISNLNRQHCFNQDIGKNKAQVTSKYIKEINPDANIIIHDKFLNNLDEVNDYKFDIVINTIDFDNDFLLQINSYCLQNNILEIFPLNLEFVGTVMIYKDPINQIFKNYKKEILDACFSKLGEKANEQYQYYLNNMQSFEFDPQNGIATYQTASLVAQVILKHINNEGIRKYPDFYLTKIH